MTTEKSTFKTTTTPMVNSASPSKFEDDVKPNTQPITSGGKLTQAIKTENLQFKTTSAPTFSSTIPSTIFENDVKPNTQSITTGERPTTKPFTSTPGRTTNTLTTTPSPESTTTSNPNSPSTSNHFPESFYNGFSSYEDYLNDFYQRLANSESPTPGATITSTSTPTLSDATSTVAQNDDTSFEDESSTNPFDPSDFTSTTTSPQQGVVVGPENPDSIDSEDNLEKGLQNTTKTAISSILQDLNNLDLEVEEASTTLAPLSTTADNQHFGDGIISKETIFTTETTTNTANIPTTPGDIQGQNLFNSVISTTAETPSSKMI